MDSAKKYSDPIGKSDKPDSPKFSTEEEAQRAGTARAANCIYNGQAYSIGAQVCQAGTLKTCTAWGWIGDQRC
jgi:hypothetical protein